MAKNVPPHPDGVPGGEARFATTHWSVVMAAAKGKGTEARKALAALCKLYWYPLYAFVRRQGCTVADAEDLTQGFFTRFLEKGSLETVSPKKGKFRSYLLGALKHFLSNERDKKRALKRGGGRVALPLEFADAETRYLKGPGTDVTPEMLFDYSWAITLLQHVLERLESESKRSSTHPLFLRIKPLLTGEECSQTYQQTGLELGMSEGAVKVAVHRLRKQYKSLLLEEIAHTVDEPGGVEEELQALFEAVGGAKS